MILIISQIKYVDLLLYYRRKSLSIYFKKTGNLSKIVLLVYGAKPFFNYQKKTANSSKKSCVNLCSFIK